MATGYDSAFRGFADACFVACAALPRQPTYRAFDMAACRLQVQGWGQVELAFFTDALAHREISPFADGSASDLTIWLADAHCAGLQLPPPFWNWRALGPLGSIPHIDYAEGFASFQQVGNVFTLLDRPNRRALIWANDLRDLPEWERSFPFRTLLHHWLAPTRWVLAHAAGVGTWAGGVLLTGRGGSGKSTSSLACLAAGMGYAGDDFVLIDPEAGVVHSLYNVAKLDADTLYRFPDWTEWVTHSSNVPGQKRQLFVQHHLSERVLHQFPLRAILLPRFTGGRDTTRQPATPADALLALAPSTMALLGAGPDTFQKLTALVNRYPVFWLDTGTDLPQIPATLQTLLTQMNPTNDVPDMEPLISVIMPVYNAERFVGDAIRSVLAQGYPNVEIICVDDGSTDSSAQIVQAFGPVVRYVYQPNQGPAAARNRAFDLVRGTFVTFLDNDDLFPPHKFRQQLATFAAEPELDVVFGKTQYIFLDGSNPERFQFPDHTRTVWNILLGAGLFRTEVFRRIGLFNPTLKIGEDGDWYNRAREQGVRIRTTDEVMLYYRHHDANYTRDQELVKSTLLKAIKYSLDRRRAGQTPMPLPAFSDFRQQSATNPPIADPLPSPRPTA